MHYCSSKKVFYSPFYLSSKSVVPFKDIPSSTRVLLDNLKRYLLGVFAFSSITNRNFAGKTGQLLIVVCIFLHFPQLSVLIVSKQAKLPVFVSV